MASSLLSAFGITPAAPPASAYADQTAETANLAEAKSQLASMTSTLGLALSAAKLAGVNTTNLENLNAEAASLSSGNMTSAQLQAKTTALSEKLATAKATQDAQRQADAITAMQDAVTTIQKRAAAVKADTTTSAQLLKQYLDLQQAAQDALKALKAAPAKSSGSSGSGKDTDTTPEPVIPDPSSLLSQLDDLDTAKDAEENKSFNWTRLGKKVTSVMMFYGTIISIAIGAVLGAIIMSNVYASDSFWGIKLYYFIYGAVFFPLSLIYGVAKPPYWVSGIIPLYSLDPVIQEGGAFTFPKLPPIPNLAAITQSITGTNPLAKVVTALAPAPKPAAPKPAAPKPVPKPALAPPTMPAPPPPPKDPNQPVAPPPPSISTTDRLFGYKLVNPNTPTTAQTSSKNMLRYFAIGDLAFLGISAVYYGVDKLITSNLIKV
jgi:hypothetical protein